MSVWIERVHEHGVHQQLEAYGSIVSELAEGPALDPDARESLSRLDQVRIAAQRQLAAADPLLVSLAGLNSIQSHAEATTVELQQFRANASLGHLANANTNADKLLGALPQLLSGVVPHDLEALRDTTTSFKKSIGQSLRHVEADRQAAEERLKALKQQAELTRQEVEVQKGRLDTAIAEFQRQFSEAEARRSADYSAAEKGRADEAAKLISEWDESIRGDYDEWAAQLKALESSVKSELNDVLAKGAASHSEAAENLRARADVALKEMEKRLQRAQDLVYVIANTGMVGGYQKTALQERKSANRWRTLAVAAMLGLVAFAIFAFVATVAGTFSWALFAGRAFVAACFGILAAYSARQADRHEEVERNARKIELALASMNPYMEGMPEQMQQELKREIALKVFAPATEPEVVKAAKVSGTTADLLRMALEALNEMAKK